MTYVDCPTCREAVSARLDGEAEPAPAEHTDEHLASCPACRSWQEHVTATARTIRVRQASDVPDLANAILEVAVPPSSTRGWWARIALIGVAAAQLGLALSQLLGVGAPQDTEHHAAGAPTAGHLFNESTAWNMALGIGLLWAAFRSRTTSGLIPVIGGFVLLIGFYSVHDLVSGAVSTSRVFGHGLLLAGLGLLVVINRWYNDPEPRPGHNLGDPVDAETGTGATEPDDTAEPGHTGPSRSNRHLRPAGQHHAA